jgi:signal transduction histidine kinase
MAKVAVHDGAECGGGEEQSADATARTDRLVSLALAAGAIAHDLNNLLVVTLVSCESLARERNLSDNGRESVGVIHDSSRRAAALVGRLLTLGRGAPPDASAVDVNGAVTVVSNLLAGVLGADVRIELELYPGLPLVQADAVQLEHSLMNLMLNARASMKDGGTIRVQTGQREQARGFDGTELREPCVVVAVSDTGAGMAPEVRARAFDPFFSTKPAALATGLGLSSVHHWLRSSGGVIDVESEVGRGTTFTLALRCPG